MSFFAKFKYYIEQSLLKAHFALSWIGIFTKSTHFITTQLPINGFL